MRRRTPCARRLESSCAQWLKPAGSFPSLVNSNDRGMMADLTAGGETARLSIKSTIRCAPTLR